MVNLKGLYWVTRCLDLEGGNMNEQRFTKINFMTKKGYQC